MKRHDFKRGSVLTGVFQIVFACLFIVIALSVTLPMIVSNSSAMFMAIPFCAIFVVAGIYVLIQGIRMVANGKKSNEVEKKGRPSQGRILDLNISHVSETRSGHTSSYEVYYLLFEYTSDSGNLCEQKEQISLKLFDELQGRALVPILVLGERAIFDINKFEAQDNQDYRL